MRWPKNVLAAATQTPNDTTSSAAKQASWVVSWSGPNLRAHQGRSLRSAGLEASPMWRNAGAIFSISAAGT